MSVTHPAVRSVTAPNELGLDTRVSFREAAFAELAMLAEGGVLRVELGMTRRVDSAGLSALILIQRHAAERRQRVVLQDASEEFRYLLVLTELANLFELEPRPA